MRHRILVVDDEEAVRFFTAYGLTQANWQVYEAESGEAALAVLEETPCDVMLLDLRMEGIDGLTVMREVKKRWPETMVIIMTAYASIDSAIEAVRQGAFDYLRKPCSVEDIIKCANRAITEKNKLDQQRQLVRQAKTNLSTEAGPLPVSVPTVCTGDLVIDTGSHTVSLAGNSVPITPTEYGILAILVRSLGQPVSMEQLIKQGLEYNPQNPQAQETLRVHISRLRRKIGSKYILTIRGGSYALANIPTE